MVTDDDIIAIHRANATDGANAALAELRRHWPGLTDRAAAVVLVRVLAIQVTVPKPPRIQSVPHYEKKLPKEN